MSRATNCRKVMNGDSSVKSGVSSEVELSYQVELSFQVELSYVVDLSSKVEFPFKVEFPCKVEFCSEAESSYILATLSMSFALNPFPWPLCAGGSCSINRHLHFSYMIS